MLNFRRNVTEEQNSCTEIIELDVMLDGEYQTTCRINVQLLMVGVKTFPCGNGDSHTLTFSEYAEALHFLKEARKQVTEKIPVKTIEAWKKSGIPTWGDFAEPGDHVSWNTVLNFADIIPPEVFRETIVQVGEPYSYEMTEDGRHGPTFITFARTGGESADWIYAGLCFHDETINRVSRTELDALIEEVREYAKFHQDVYRKYQFEWMWSHGITLKDISDLAREWLDEKLIDKNYNVEFFDYVEERGFSGSIYGCFEEFMETEYLDRSYMVNLLDEEQQQIYREDPLLQ